MKINYVFLGLLTVLGLQADNQLNKDVRSLPKDQRMAYVRRFMEDINAGVNKRLEGKRLDEGWDDFGLDPEIGLQDWNGSVPSDLSTLQKIYLLKLPDNRLTKKNFELLVRNLGSPELPNDNEGWVLVENENDW